MDCYGVRPYGVTTKTQKFPHISLVLRNLHWLPVTKRIEFKILTKTYKALNGMACPTFVIYCRFITPNRNLHSASRGLSMVGT